MKHDKLFHILRFLRFYDNKTDPDKLDDNYGHMQKMRTISDKFSDPHAEYDSPNEYFPVDKIIVLFIFKQYTPKKHKGFGIKTYTSVYLHKERQCTNPSMIAAHAIVTGLNARLENVGHKLYMDNFFSSPALLDDLHTETTGRKTCQRILDRKQN
jgi:hypothetical protein